MDLSIDQNITEYIKKEQGTINKLVRYYLDFGFTENYIKKRIYQIIYRDFDNIKESKDLIKGVRRYFNAITVVKIQRSQSIELRNKFINLNLGLILNVANRYYPWTYYKVEVADIINNGFFGLVKAIEKFDIDRGLTFNEVAVYYIRNSLRDLLRNHSSVIRVTDCGLEKKRKILKAVEELTNKNGGYLYNEVAKILNMSPNEVSRILGVQNVASLSETYTNDDHNKYDYLSDNSYYSMISVFENKDLRRILLDIMQFLLNEKEYFVVINYHGLNGEKPKTLEEIGNIFKCTRENIRLILEDAYYKIRTSEEIKKVFDYTNNPDRAEKRLEQVIEDKNKVNEERLTSKGEVPSKNKTKYYNINNIKDYFKNIFSIIDMLNKNELKILYKRFGKDLNGLYEVSKEDMELLYKVLYNIEIRLNVRESAHAFSFNSIANFDEFTRPNVNSKWIR